MRIIRAWPIIAAIAVVACMLCFVIDQATHSIPRTDGRPRLSELIALPFFGIYLVATNVFAPWHAFAFMRKKAARDVAAGRRVVYPWWTWLFLGPVLIGDTRARFPLPVSAFLIWLLCVLSAWLFFVFAMVAVMVISAAIH